MISRLAKNIAHFFTLHNITEESKEVIYAYGMELLLSDVLNTFIVLLIALISHTLPAVIIFTAVFMGLRQVAGGYHANSHLSCMLTLTVIMLFFFLRYLQCVGEASSNFKRRIYSFSSACHFLCRSRSAPE